MRSFEKVLLMTLCLVLLAGVVMAKVLDGTLYEIPKTAIAPVIDGVQDPVWKTLDANFQNYYANGTVVPDDFADLMGWHKLMYDDKNLYLLFYTQDEAKTITSTNSWEKDAVEFYSDADNSKGAAFDTKNDMQFNWTYLLKGKETWKAAAPPALFDTTGAKFKFKDDTSATSGYWFEAVFPLKSLKIEPVAGTKIGVELQQNDNDDGKVRESISKWWLKTGDTSWQVPSSWGTAILSDRVVGLETEILKTKTAPVIDGKMDAIWANASQVTMNSLGNGSTYAYDYHDYSYRLYTLYDDNNLYAFFDVWDDVKTTTSTNSWEKDAVELYVDADNSKGAAFDTKNDMQFNWTYLLKGKETWKAAAPPALFDTTGAKYKITDSALGYCVEMVLPLKGLKVEPVVGAKIGFEAQVNDNDDGKVRKSIGKWWLEKGDDSWQVPGHWGTAKLGDFMKTAVQEQPAQMADNFQMAQNYPNPFNPVTTIAYALKSSGKVRLAVYDLMGKEVAVLVDGVQSAGSHQILFSAEKLTSGIYFYKLQTGDRVFTSKMTLMK
jgi:uncharacterized protein (DUF2249 family)